MKTETKLIRMKAVVQNLEGSGYKMGDHFTLTVGDDTVTHDAREYYSGRGAKYNSSIRHGDTIVKMTERELNIAHKPIFEDAKKERAYQRATKRIQTNKGLSLYIKENMNVDLINQIKGSAFNTNTYRGCGKYWVAVRSGRIVASIQMGSCPVEDFSKFRKLAKLQLAKYGTVISGEGSGTMFYANNSEDLSLFSDSKIYDVPNYTGGRHTNFEARA